MKNNIIGVVSGKGGVGKTTLSCLMGLALSSNKKKTLLIDADIGLNNLDIILKVKTNNYDLKDVIKGFVEIKDIYTRINENLSLISLYKTTNLNDFNIFKSTILFEKLIQGYEYIIIDSPAGIDKGFEFTLNVSKKIYIVINPNMASVSDALKVEELIKKKSDAKYSYILNKAHLKNNDNFIKSLKYVGANISIVLKENKAYAKGNFYSKGMLDFLARRIMNETQEESCL